MNPLNCHDLEDQLDLYAAGEGDAATRAAVEHHVADCPACANQLREARRLQGLLDLQARAPAGLQRLRTLIDKEDRRMRQPRRVLPFVSMLTAAAALVLLTFGLTDVGPQRTTTNPLYVVADARFTAEMKAAPGGVGPPGAVEAHMKDPVPLTAEQKLVLPLDRSHLPTRDRAKELPPPPAVELALQIRNTSSAEQVLHFEDERTRLSLELSGPGVLRREAGNQGLPIPSEAMRLRPGATETVWLHSLRDGVRGRIQFLYWTEPGDYALTIRLRVPVSEGTILSVPVKELEMATYISPPVLIKVIEKR